MTRAFFVLVCFILLSACTQRMICPAYQSAFIYDKDELRKKFSYLNEDSTPKVFYTASKTKYLIAEPVSYRKKMRSMNTVVMKDVNVKIPDSLVIGTDEIVAGAELDLAARSVIDSIYIVDVPQDSVEAEEDSVYVITVDKEVRLLKYDFPDSLIYDPNTGKYVAETPKYVITEVRYNVEQDNYMWYLRDYLILPDVRLAQQQKGEEQTSKTSKGKKEKKGFVGFFKGLFKKKNKDATDSTSLQAPTKAADDFDYVDEEELPPGTNAIEPETKTKKGGFSLRKKKDKSTDPPAPAEEKPARKKKNKKASKDEPKPEEKKKEEGDDGF